MVESDRPVKSFDEDNIWHEGRCSGAILRYNLRYDKSGIETRYFRLLTVGEIQSTKHKRQL